MTNAEKYTYRVIWSEEDGEHVGLCAEFPGLSHLAPTVGEAANGIVDLVSGLLTITVGYCTPLRLRFTLTFALLDAWDAFSLAYMNGSSYNTSKG